MADERTATAEEFKAAWRTAGGFDDAEVAGWIEAVRKGGYMTHPDGARLVLRPMSNDDKRAWLREKMADCPACCPADVNGIADADLDEWVRSHGGDPS